MRALALFLSHSGAATPSSLPRPTATHRHLAASVPPNLRRHHSLDRLSLAVPFFTLTVAADDPLAAGEAMPELDACGLPGEKK